MKPSNIDNWILKTEALPALSREGLESLQLERLNHLLSRVRARGGIYAGYPERLDSLEDLAALPFTTPQMLASSPGKFLLTSQSDVSRVISGATSGTTGAAKRVFYTETDTDHTVGFYEAGIGEMLAPGEKCLICFPFSGPFGLGDLIARAVENLGGIPIRAGFGQTWGELRELVRQVRPETCIGFPVPLLSLGRMMGDFPIQRALVSGDACPEGVMEELEGLLGHPLYPHYGSRECALGGAITCPAFRGMHLRENHIIAEIVDENGNVLPEGACGELVLTTIGAQAMPLIRYRTGDFTRFLPECPCGSITRRIDRVRRQEGAIAMEALDSRLFRLPGLVDFRAAWDGALEIAVRGSVQAQEIEAAVRELYPGCDLRVTVSPARWEDRPMYLGKRHVVQRADT